MGTGNDTLAYIAFPLYMAALPRCAFLIARLNARFRTGWWFCAGTKDSPSFTPCWQEVSSVPGAATLTLVPAAQSVVFKKVLDCCVRNWDRTERSFPKVPTMLSATAAVGEARLVEVVSGARGGLYGVVERIGKYRLIEYGSM